MNPNTQKLMKQPCKIGDKVRVVNLNGIKVKYMGIIRWIGILDGDTKSSTSTALSSPSTDSESTPNSKSTPKSTKKSKKRRETFGIELLDAEGHNNGTPDGSAKRLFITIDDAKTGIFIKRIDFRKHIEYRNRAQSKADKKQHFEQTIKRKRNRRLRNDAQMFGNQMNDFWTERIDMIRPDGGGVGHKLGPREIGRNKYKGIEWSEEEQERQRAAKKAEMERRKREEAAADLVKLGPRDMGKMKYKGTKMDYQDDSDFLSDRGSTKTKEVTDEERAQLVKLGPRDMGKMKYKGLKYSEEEQERIRAQKREEEERRKREEAAADLAKLGPRDMGILIYFVFLDVFCRENAQISVKLLTFW